MDEPRNNIRHWRKMRGFTLAGLAERLGVNHAVLSRVETGRVGYTQKMLEALSAVLRVSPSELVSDAVEPELTITPEVTEMLNRIFKG